jgi:hypothetical protein
VAAGGAPGELWGVLAEAHRTDDLAGPHRSAAAGDASYFASIGIPLLAGRDFNKQDGAASLRRGHQPAMAKQLWPNETRGKRFVSATTTR